MSKSRTTRIALILLIAAFVSVFSAAISVSAASGAEIDRLTVDFRSEAAVKRSAFNIYKHTPTEWEPDPMLAGKYSFDSEKQAVKISYSPCEKQQNYRLMLRPNGDNTLASGLKYAVVVYMAKADEPYKLSIWNTPKVGYEAIFTDKGTDTAGKFIISEPVDISLSATDDSMFVRWNKRNAINTINFTTNEVDAEFYVKELSFFKSAEDAKAYYASADLSKSPISGPAKVDFVITDTGDDASVSKTDVKPVILKLGSDTDLKYQNAFYYKHGDNTTEGRYEAVTLDGVKAVRLYYEPHKDYPYASYRCMPKFAAGRLTSDHKYVRITFMTNDTSAAPVVIQNNASHAKVTIVPDASVSGGKWTRSTAVYIDTAGILERFVKGSHCILGYDSNTDGKEIYISDLAFFGSEAQAYEYYGDSISESAQGSNYSIMNFGEGTTGTVLTGDDYGINTVNTADGTLDISFAPTTNAGVSYMAKVKFANTDSYDIDNLYVRAIYSAKNPEGVKGLSLLMRNDKTHEVICLEDNLADTNGFVLSDVTKLTADMAQRFDGSGSYKSTMHNSVIVNTIAEGGEYRIKALCFFPTRAAAEAFTYTAGTHSIAINGNDIKNYKIVIGEDAPIFAADAAEVFRAQVKYLTDISLPIVTDSEPVGDHEILIGSSNRAKSTAPLNEAQANGYQNKLFVGCVDGNTLSINANLPPCIGDAVESYLTTYLYKSLTTAPEKINLTDECKVSGISSALNIYTLWDAAIDVADPTVFSEDFDTDDGYFTEENGEDNFRYIDGEYKTDDVSNALSYIHVYEKNVDYTAKLKYSDASADASFGLMARYNSAEAYVKAGYDAAKAVWYIESREGIDFYLERIAEAPARLTEGEAYTLGFKVHENTAVLTVNGAVVLTADSVHHTSPGRVAVYANNTALSVDDVTVTLLSGEGTIFKDVKHTKLPDEQYREGGSAFEMTDGSLIYQTHFSGYNAFKSTDNGTTWQRIEKWTDTTQYPNILRLENGDFIKIITQTRNGKSYKVSQTSSDDGKTWIDGGIICHAMYNGNTNGTAVNMNDKVSQAGISGRVFYCQNYEVLSGDPVNGRMVFCEFYYSDDNGKTWKKSDTDSWEIAGNETETHFGECKILECADGTLRMYNSWNAYGCIVYSESKDNGVTWGPLMTMPEFVCARSSMQFYRDQYADNETTYYMVWVYSKPENKSSGMARSRLALAKSTDGKNWEYIGDLWRWESNYKVKTSAIINHIVDPFVMTTEDYLIVGTGLSERMATAAEVGNYHQAQRQHIWAIPKASLPEGRQVVLRENLYNFTDVTTHDSYYEAVKYAVDEGLFNGTSETTFSPAATMTRAMFVTVLGRLDKADVSAYTTPTFSDVLEGQWYTSYVEWAAANGIVNGMGDGIYGINGEITVQQACLILARYADFATATNAATNTVGGDALGAPKSSADFADGANVADWAKEGVDWAIANGVYAPNGNINPASAASRALVATMFANYVKAYKA